MLIIFGCSWPANIHKSLTSRTTLGKSLAFEILVSFCHFLLVYFFQVSFKPTVLLNIGFSAVESVSGVKYPIRWNCR